MTNFIYNQNDIPKEQWRYGLRSSAAAGCGWIATYNALHLLHKDVDIPRLISYYECQLPLIHGTFGTTIWGPVRCFRNWGFPVRLYHRIQDFDEAARKVPASILFFHWRKGVKMGGHFATCRYNGSQFIGFNTYKNSHGPDPLGDSLSAFLKRNHYFGAILMTIGQRDGQVLRNELQR